MKEYREAFSAGEYDKASELLSKSELKKDEKSKLLWHMESGTVAFNQGKLDKAIKEFQRSLELIDELYTKRLSAKAASFLINDASDVFYGASFERSLAHYYLSRSYYARYQKSHAKLDLQGARATILAWDTYFTDLQRSAAPKTIYQTDLMLKIFGAEIHEVSEIRTDKQISLQLYKDALRILETMGGVFGVFNSQSNQFIKDYEEAISEDRTPKTKAYVATSAQKDLKNFLHYKILALTKEIRGTDFAVQVKTLKPDPDVLKKVNEPGNVVILLEEGFIPQKVPKVFDFGLKGAANSVDSPQAKNFIMTVGADMVALFAMNTLGMTPAATGASGFVFGAEATKLAVKEAAIQFELPMIESSNPLKRYELVVLNDKGEVVKHEPLNIISENGEIAKIVLEEDAVSRYVKTGTRVAVRHLIAIAAAMGVYQSLKSKGDFIAKTAAMATYVASSKGIAELEKADTRHWTTLPQAFRMSELRLPPGRYQVAISAYEGDRLKEDRKILGDIQVGESGKAIHSFKLISP